MPVSRKSWQRLLLNAAIFIPLFAVVWGNNIWGHFADRRENARLRAEACERMATRGFILKDIQNLCLRSPEVYHDGLAAAVMSQTSHVQAQVTAELEQLDAVTSEIETAEFARVSMDAFLERHENSQFPAQQAAFLEPSQIVLSTPWLIITGYGGVRIEDPRRDETDQPNAGVGLAMDRSLQFLLGGALDRICRRTSSISLGCSGTVFITVAEGPLAPEYTVVGIELTPISQQQVFWTGFDTLRPPFAGGSNYVQIRYMQRFLDNFPTGAEPPEAQKPDRALN